MKKWEKLFKLKGGQLYWKESRGRSAAGSPAGTNHGDGYKTVRIDGKAVYAHRIIQEMSTGKKANGFVDHKDRNRSNNKPKNLRTTTSSENNKNRKSWAKKK
jgi:uncharacterized membrane protein YebE (DUF533 family)